METSMGRRELMGSAGALALAATLGGSAMAQKGNGSKRIIAVNCSPRKGMTTSASLALCLAAAKEQDPESLCQTFPMRYVL